MAIRVMAYISGLKTPLRYQERAVPKVTEEKALVRVVGLKEINQGLSFIKRGVEGLVLKVGIGGSLKYLSVNMD